MVQNKTLKTILRRKSIRKFKPTEVSRDKIEQIVKAGQRSPTACGVEAYSFILLTDFEKRERIIQETVSHVSTRKFMEEAPVWIIICTDFARRIELLNTLKIKNEFSETSKFMLGIIDAALAAENMVLAAESYGLGSCFVGSLWTAPKRVAEILKLPKNVLPVVLLCIGYSNETPSNNTRWPLEAVLHENEYIMPNKNSILEYVSMRKNWDVSFPYKLSLEAEQKIRKEWNELGFLI
jgi:nitroreductase